MDVSSEERVRIATDFIKAAPPGEFKEVVNDVRVLLDDDGLLSKASGVFYEYATDQFTTVDLPDGEPALVTKCGHISDNTFYDPRSRKSFKYDYLKNEARDVADLAAEPGSEEKWRVAIEGALKPYLDECYPNHYSAVYGEMEGAEVKITVCLEDHKFNPNNFWNGKWTSKWDVVFRESEGSQAKVTGVMSVKVHYYEDGNVQLLSNKSVEAPFDITSPSEVATKLVANIKRLEMEYHMAINENYNSMSNTTFKALRRNLPVTQSLIDWHKLHGLQVGKDIMNR